MIMPAQFAWENVNNENPLVMQEPGQVVNDPEPKVSFADKDGYLLTIKSTGIEYNREDRPHDSYQQAAEKIFDFMKKRAEPALAHNEPIYDIGLKAWQNYEAKHFVICATGIQHNFELDNWHWWMIEHLNTLLKTKLK